MKGFGIEGSYSKGWFGEVFSGRGMVWGYCCVPSFEF